jgi:rSAM/selenodomain-associated transferase 2
MLSIVVPCLNEAEGIADTLAALAPLRARGAEVIVVDGGSRDGTLERAVPHASLAISASRGRGQQMNAGAARARGEIFLFMHADTMLPASADVLIVEGLKRARRGWGRFDIAIAGRHPLLRVVELQMNLRSRLTGVASGHQAIFVTRSLFTAAGGFPEFALMEDVALCDRLKRYGPPLCLNHRITTSARRWERNGILSTAWLRWRLRLAYRLGADPGKLALQYDRP